MGDTTPMSNYDQVPGVHISRYPNGSDEPTLDTRNAFVEELYFDDHRGNLHLSFGVGDDMYYLDIPVVARGDWNEFADSLPRWDVSPE